MRKRDIRFSLDFKSDDFGVVDIDEPIGYYNVDLSLDQKATGLGRDEAFSGGDYSFEFSPKRNHYFEKLMYYFNLFGYESNVDLIISEQGAIDVRLELDFATADTDEYQYFKCKAVQKASLQILKRRKDVKIDLFSDKDVDGNYIEPLKPINMYLSSKPITAESKWDMGSVFSINVGSDINAKNVLSSTVVNSQTITITYYTNYVNPYQNLLAKAEIKESLSIYDALNNSNINNFIILDANLAKENVDINISNVTLIFRFAGVTTNYYPTNPLNLILAKGISYESATKYILWSTSIDEKNKSKSLDKASFNLKIPRLEKGEKIWLFFAFDIYTKKIYVKEKQSNVSLDIFSGNVNITADETYYPSIVPSFRLLDVMKQVVKSTSGLNVNAPRFDVYGEFYDNFLFNGNTLRNARKDGKPFPFYVSLDDIEKSLTEMRGDWEIGIDGNVFFGIEKDFYTSEEIWFFDNLQFSQMRKTYNPIYSINQFGLKYKKFQSQKEKETKGSSDVIHGESMWTLYNKRVENKKDTSIEWIRDAFHLRLQQDKAFEITEDTATQDDDELFCIDGIQNKQQIVLNITITLKHEFDRDRNLLILTNKGDFNFLVLGVLVGEKFFILNTNNAGEYLVKNAKESIIELESIRSGANISNNGIFDTNFNYVISESGCPYKNYTSEEITNINGLSSGDKYTNLRYSLKRNIINYYQSFLATCNLFWKDKPIIKSVIKNNPDCEFTYKGVTTKEGGDFIPANPILTPYLFEEMVFANIEHSEYNQIQELVRSKRGYMRTIDNTGRVIKFYPKKLKYALGKEELTIIGEEKYEPVDMTINTNNLNFLLINNETKIRKIDYEFIEDKLNIYDMQRQRLYNPVYWFKVSINNYQPKTQKELEDLLKLI